MKSMMFIVMVLSTGFFSGYIPWASGTFASLIACCIWIFLSRESCYYIVTLSFIAAGFLTTGYAERHLFKERDSSKIVIDEMAGMLVALLSFTFTLSWKGFVYLLSGFILFRFLDIVKPVPIRSLQKVGSGPGIMLDDLGSAAITNGLLQVLRIFLFRL